MDLLYRNLVIVQYVSDDCGYFLSAKGFKNKLFDADVFNFLRAYIFRKTRTDDYRNIRPERKNVLSQLCAGHIWHDLVGYDKIKFIGFAASFPMAISNVSSWPWL